MPRPGVARRVPLPASRVQWYKTAGDPVRSAGISPSHPHLRLYRRGRHLAFTRVQFYHAGNYTCRISSNEIFPPGRLQEGRLYMIAARDGSEIELHFRDDRQLIRSTAASSWPQPARSSVSWRSTVPPGGLRQGPTCHSKRSRRPLEPAVDSPQKLLRVPWRPAGTGLAWCHQPPLRGAARVYERTARTLGEIVKYNKVDALVRTVPPEGPGSPTGSKTGIVTRGHHETSRVKLVMEQRDRQIKTATISAAAEAKAFEDLRVKYFHLDVIPELRKCGRLSSDHCVPTAAAGLAPPLIIGALNRHLLFRLSAVTAPISRSAGLRRQQRPAAPTSARRQNTASTVLGFHRDCSQLLVRGVRARSASELQHPCWGFGILDGLRQDERRSGSTKYKNQ
uniref:Ig-like domain-containing protein n=1 Tax=Macrostomum lignano TaxID=282301 RepID=A0A1I8FN40_9PLAT